MTGDAAQSLDHTRLSIAVGPLVGPVLARVIALHAARAGFPIDRVNDSLLLADALGARAPAQVVDERVTLTVRSSAGRLDLRLGPLRSGGSERILAGAALPGGSRVVERLADDVRVRDSKGGEEVLVLRVDAAG